MGIPVKYYITPKIDKILHWIILACIVLVLIIEIVLVMSLIAPSSTIDMFALLLLFIACCSMCAHIWWPKAIDTINAAISNMPNASIVKIGNAVKNIS